MAADHPLSVARACLKTAWFIEEFGAVLPLVTIAVAI